MKKLLAWIVAIVSTFAWIIALATPVVAAAACNPFLVASGGTGVCSIVTGTVPFGNGTGKIATSSVFTYTTATSNLAVPYASTTAISAGSGTATGPSISVGGNASSVGIYLNGSGKLGFASGGGGLTWDGTVGAFYPNTDGTRNLGIDSTNRWNKLFTNYASTTAISGTTICISTDCKSAWPGGQAAGFQISTTTIPSFAVGNLTYLTSTIPTTIAGVATTSLGVTAPITFSGTIGAQVGGIGGSFGCTSASSGVTGCLTGTDWTTFNNKQGPGFQISTTTVPSFAIGNVAYITGTTPTSIAGVSTSSISLGTSLSVTGGSLGAQIGGTALTINTVQAITTGSSPTFAGLTLTSFSGAVSAAAGVLSAGTLSIANGGTNATSFGTTNGIVAFDSTRLVNFANFTLTSSLMTITSASSTNITTTGFLGIPNASTTPTLVAGSNTAGIAVDSKTASSSLRYADGAATRSLFPDGLGGLPFASSTLAYRGAFSASGTTTILLMRTYRPLTLLNVYCDTDQGTAYWEMGTGAATSSGKCTTGGTQMQPSANNTWVMGQAVYIGIGTSASAPNIITVSPDIRKDSD